MAFSPTVYLALIPLAAPPTYTVVRVTAGTSALPRTPVTFRAPSDWTGRPVLLIEDSGVEHAAQWENAARAPTLTFVAPALAPRESKALRVNFAAPAKATAGVQCTPTADGIVVTVDGAPFTTYRTNAGAKPFCWPLLGPNGERVTQNGPKDHIHHRSFWFTHGKVNNVDFWSESPTAGRTVHREFGPIVSGPIFGEIKSHVDWIAKDGRKVCADVRTLRFYDVPGERILDFAIAVRAGREELVFGDDKEGTFGVRVAASMSVDQGKGKPKGGTLVNAEGLLDGAVWGKKSDWCDYYGPTDGRVAGIAILDDAANLRHPTTWHARTYGLFTANPFGLSYFTDKKQDGTYRIAPNHELRLNYRVYIHSGDVKAAAVADHYAAFAAPPTVEIR